MDPISAVGVAGSVVGIVSLGMELARVLQGQIDQIATAKDRLSHFVFEIKATALALTDLRDLLLSTRDPEDRLFNDRGYDVINLVVDRCTIVYRNIAVLISKAGAASLANVDDFVDKNKNSSAKTIIPLNMELSKADHLLWPFKFAKVEQCFADLERLKLQLILMLNVAALAKKKKITADDVTAGYESDEETLLVDQVYYTNEDVDRAEMKYEEALSPQSLGKDNIYGAPDLVLGSNYLAANDLLDNWPHMSEGGGIPSPAEIRQLGVMIRGFTLDPIWYSFRWSLVPVTVATMQRAAIQNSMREKGSKSPWDDFTRLPFVYRKAIARLIRDCHWDLMDERNYDEVGHIRYSQPKILFMEASWDRKTTFSAVLKGLNLFHRRVPKIPKAPQLRVILGCAPLIHEASIRSRELDIDASSSDEEYVHRRNSPRRTRHARTEKVVSDSSAVEYGDAPIHVYSDMQTWRNNPESYVLHDPSGSGVNSAKRDFQPHSSPSRHRKRTERFDEDNLNITKDREERKKPGIVRETSTGWMYEEGKGPASEKNRIKTEQRLRGRPKERESEIGEVREWPKERYYEDSYDFNDRRFMLPSRVSSSIATDRYALVRRQSSFAKQFPRQDSYSSRRSHQPLRLTNRAESFNNPREPRYQSLPYKNDGYNERGYSTFDRAILEDQVPPSKESKIDVAENLLRLWTTIFDIIGEKVRDRIFDQGTFSHHQSNPTITPFPQRPRVSLAVNPTILSSAEESSSSPSGHRDMLLVRKPDQNRNRTARPYKSGSHRSPSLNLSHDESSPRRALPRSVTIEDEHEDGGEPGSEDERDFENERASENEQGPENERGSEDESRNQNQR